MPVLFLSVCMCVQWFFCAFYRRISSVSPSKFGLYFPKINAYVPNFQGSSPLILSPLSAIQLHNVSVKKNSKAHEKHPILIKYCWGKSIFRYRDHIWHFEKQTSFWITDFGRFRIETDIANVTQWLGRITLIAQNVVLVRHRLLHSNTTQWIQFADKRLCMRQFFNNVQIWWQLHSVIPNTCMYWRLHEYKIIFII
jgi:hypothetical protein